MCADMHIFCIIKRRFHLRVCRRTGYRLKYFFKRCIPGSAGLFNRKLHITVFDCRLVGHFTDHGISHRKFRHFACFHFTDQITEVWAEQISDIHIMLNLHTHLITECHLGYGSSDTVAIQSICGNHLLSQNICMESCIEIHDLLVFRKIIRIPWNMNPYQFISCLFKFRCNDILFFCHIHCEGNQCRRNINIIKRTGHTVFSADGRQAKAQLCIICTQQCRKRLTPSLRIFSHTTEVFLERKTNLAVITAGCHNPGNGFQNRIDSSMIWAPTGHIWIESIAHHCYRIGFSVGYRNFSNHRLCLCHLIFSTIRHQNRTCTDGGVKHLHQTFLRTGIEI